jgi:hypothetical protein
MASITWQPTDNQIVHMLVNRGYLDQDQVLFATAQQLLSDQPSLLSALRAQGYVDEATTHKVVKEVRQDALVRQLLLEHRVLTSRQLAEAVAKQRGTQRTLMQTLITEALCSRETLRSLLGMVRDHAAQSESKQRAFPLAGRRLGPQHIA